MTAPYPSMHVLALVVPSDVRLACSRPILIHHDVRLIACWAGHLNPCRCEIFYLNV